MFYTCPGLRCYSRPMKPIHLLSIVAAAVVLAACAGKDRDRAQAALSAPLVDLNLVRNAIPDVLVAAVQAPYRVPLAAGCAPMHAELAALDEALGEDVDVPASADPGLIEQGRVEARNAAFGLLQSTAEDVLPYRNWLRKLSGAERHSEAVAHAIVAGTARRGFVKGLAISQGCELP